MLKSNQFSGLLWALLLMLPSVFASASQTNPTGLQIVTCNEGVNIDSFLHELGISPKHIYRHGFKGFAAHLTSEKQERLRVDKRVLAIEEDAPVKLADQLIPTGIARMGLTNFPMAHIKGTDHRIGVDVAILDSGTQTNHPDLNVVQSASFVEQSGDDWNGHGTHVAGIIGAYDNGYGVVGVAPGVRIWSVQAIGQVESAWSNVLGGMDYIVQHSNEVAVVNCSIASTGNTPLLSLRTAVRELVNAGIVFVAAAGNSGMDLAGPDGIYGNNDDALPAALPEAMAVGAMSPTNDTVASFSNYSLIPRTNNFVKSPGGTIDVHAPGVDILSTYTNGEYAVLSGTSMSAPHVAGLVALYIAANGRATNAAGVYKIRQAIVDASLPQSRWNSTNTLEKGLPAPLAMPSESWIPAPYLSGRNPVTNGFEVNFQTVPGYDYTLQSKEFLADSIAWNDVSTVSGSNSLSSVTILDPSAADSKYYRLLRSPSP